MHPKNVLRRVNESKINDRNADGNNQTLSENQTNFRIIIVEVVKLFRVESRFADCSASP